MNMVTINRRGELEFSPYEIVLLEKKMSRVEDLDFKIEHISHQWTNDAPRLEGDRLVFEGQVFYKASVNAEEFLNAELLEWLKLVAKYLPEDWKEKVKGKGGIKGGLSGLKRK